jgi:2-oxoglutarate ferredoxin oxidoreductase subunit alpha
MRSLKLATLAKTLKPPTVYGDADGDLLLVGWGGNQGAIEEAVDRLRAQGRAVSSLHLRFIQPLPPGIKPILQRFRQVMTIEGNWSDRYEDELIDEDNRRYAALAMMLRSRYLVDVDCWSEARGQPIKPGSVVQVALAKLDA